MAGMAPGSVEYIEKVVKSHIRRIISRSTKMPSLGVEDICFILRNDKALIVKIKESLRIKQIKNNIDDELCDYKMGYDVQDENVNINIRNINIKNNKLMILDKITQDMDKEEYKEYAKFRETSFTSKRNSKFIEFIGVENLNSDVVEIFGIIARDLVFEIIQSSIKVRNEKYGRRKIFNFKLTSDRSPLSLREIEEGTRRVYFNLPYKI